MRALVRVLTLGIPALTLARHIAAVLAVAIPVAEASAAPGGKARSRSI